MTHVLVICTLVIDLWTSVVLLVPFELVELHCLDRVMQQFGFKQHISYDIYMSNQLHFINHSGSTLIIIG